MERTEEKLAFIGIECGQVLSTVRPKPEENRKSLFNKKQDPRKRKLYLEYQELMRKMEVQQRIQQKEESVNRRLQEIKNQRTEAKRKASQSKGKCEKSVIKEHQDQFRDTKFSCKKAPALVKKPKRHLNSTSKQNSFKIYSSQTRNPHKLPTIHQKNPSDSIRQNQPFPSKPFTSDSSLSPSLIQFGIFSQRRNCETFLRRFRTTIQKQFIAGLDLNEEDQVDRLELCLLREIKNQGRWLTQH